MESKQEFAQGDKVALTDAIRSDCLEIQGYIHTVLSNGIIVSIDSPTHDGMGRVYVGFNLNEDGTYTPMVQDVRWRLKSKAEGDKVLSGVTFIRAYRLWNKLRRKAWDSRYFLEKDDYGRIWTMEYLIDGTTTSSGRVLKIEDYEATDWEQGYLPSPLGG